MSKKSRQALDHIANDFMIILCQCKYNFRILSHYVSLELEKSEIGFNNWI